MQRILSQARTAYRLHESLIGSGAVDASLMWTLPRLALAVQVSMPPLDGAGIDYGDFVEGAAHAYGTLNELVYRRQSDADLSLLSATCTPQMRRVLASTAEELHGSERAMTYTLEASDLARRSLRAAVCDVFSSERERDLEHGLRGYDDVLREENNDDAAKPPMGLVSKWHL